MYNSTPSWVSEKLTAFFGKRNWKPELVRIKGEVENLGFDHFSDVVWEYDYYDLEHEELVSAVADTFYVIAEYFFEDEEPTALEYLTGMICSELTTAGYPLKNAGHEEIWKLTDELVYETSLSGHPFSKEMVTQVVEIQYNLFLEITNLEIGTDFSKTHFHYPWNISKDLLHVDEKKQKLFTNHFESALYVAAWVTNFEVLFDNPPPFEEINASIREYLSEHVAAFENYEAFLEFDLQDFEIYDFNDYLSEIKPKFFNIYFLAALMMANKNSNFISEYRTFMREQTIEVEKTTSLVNKYVDLGVGSAESERFIEGIISKGETNQITDWRGRLALNQYLQKKYDAALKNAFLGLNKDWEHFVELAENKNYEDARLFCFDIISNNNTDILEIILKILFEDKNENQFHAPEVAHHICKNILTTFSEWYLTRNLSTLAEISLLGYFTTASKLKIKKDLIDLSLLSLFASIFAKYVEDESQLDKALIEQVIEESNDTRYNLLSKKNITLAKFAVLNQAYQCYVHLENIGFTPRERLEALKFIVSGNPEIERTPWILSSLAFEEYCIDNFHASKNRSVELIKKRKKDYPEEMHADLLFYQAVNYKALGFLYEYGEGVVKSKSRALAHYYASNALKPSWVEDKTIADLEKSCTPSQIEKAEKLGEGLLEKNED